VLEIGDADASDGQAFAHAAGCCVVAGHALPEFVWAFLGPRGWYLRLNAGGYRGHWYTPGALLSLPVFPAVPLLGAR
jgi:hypothetical protein